MFWWFWFVPLACVTLYVWLKIILGWLPRRTVDARQNWLQRLAARPLLPPCAFCHSQTHTYREHVRIPQAELAARQDDEAWRCEGEW